MFRRLVRLLMWVVGAAAALSAFVAVGRWSPVPLRWSDVRGWLDGVSRDEALVEVVRWCGIALAGYVLVISVCAVLAEAAAAVRLVSVAALFRRVGSRAAVPVLRSRLWRAASVTAFTVTSVSTGGGFVQAAAPASVELTVESPSVGAPIVLPDGLVDDGFSGFGLPAKLGPSPARAGSPEDVWVQVQRGDTLWDLADGRYGHVDAAMIDMLAAANELADPSLIFAGQMLRFPADATPLEVPVSVVASDAATWAVHQVVAGDTLWDVINDRYGHVDGDLVWQIADLNGLEDPSSIPIGMLITLPSLGGEQSFPPPLVEDPSPAVPAVSVETALPVPPLPPRTEPVSTPVPVATTVPVTIVPVSAPTVTVSAVPAAARAGGVDDPAADDSEMFELSVRTLWWKVPMGLLLSAGLVTTIRRLRFRRLGQLDPGEQLATPPPVAAGTELAVTVAAGPGSRIATLQALLRTVTPYAREHDDPLPVRAVELFDDRVSILFSSPAPFPPAGWTTVDGGRSWEHRMVDGEVGAGRQLVTPALVTVGHRLDGGEVLLDVESAGSVALVGDRAATLGIARSMTLELATYPLGVPMDVCPIGFEVDGVEDCDRAWANTTLPRAVRVAREMLDRTAATGAVSLMAARAAIDDDDGTLDPHVFVVDAVSVVDAEQGLLDELVALCHPQSGAAVILIGGHRDAREVIEVASSTSASWSGVRLRPPMVGREAAAQVAVMFDHVANAPSEPISVSPVVADLITEPAAGDPAICEPVLFGEGDGPLPVDDAQCDVVEFCYEPPDHDVLVQLLGEVTVHGRDIKSADSVELLALLVCMRDQRPNIDTITTLLNRDGKMSSSRPATADPLRPMQQRVSRLRAKLGVGCDGGDLLPAAATGRGSLGRYQVSPRVMTDVELIEHRFQTSLELASGEALAVLRDGLAMFTGPAFRARKGYEWAWPEGVSARVYNVVTAYAARLMELSFECDDIALVLETVRCAGHVIDDPVAELPMRKLERDYADLCGNPDLAASVAEARRRLADHIDNNDALAADEA